MSSVSDEEVQAVARGLGELLLSKLFADYFRRALRPGTRLFCLKLNYQAAKKLLSKLEEHQGLNYIKASTSKKLMKKMAQFDERQLGILTLAFPGRYDTLEQNLQLESGSFGVEIAVECPDDPDSEIYWNQVVSLAPPEQTEQQFEEWKAEARRLGIYPNPDVERAAEQIIIAALGPAFPITKLKELLDDMLKRDKSKCAACKKSGEMKACKACLAVGYCSRECQKKDWPYHRKICACLKAAKRPMEHISHIAAFEK